MIECSSFFERRFKEPNDVIEPSARPWRLTRLNIDGLLSNILTPALAPFCSLIYSCVLLYFSSIFQNSCVVYSIFFSRIPWLNRVDFFWGFHFYTYSFRISQVFEGTLPNVTDLGFIGLRYFTSKSPKTGVFTCLLFLTIHKCRGCQQIEM